MENILKFNNNDPILSQHTDDFDALDFEFNQALSNYLYQAEPFFLDEFPYKSDSLDNLLNGSAPDDIFSEDTTFAGTVFDKSIRSNPVNDIVLSDLDQNENVANQLTPSINDYNTCPEASESYFPSELNHLMLDEKRNVTVIFDNNESYENSNEAKSSRDQNIPRRDQIIEDPNGRAYCMHPTVFKIISGDMNVKQQPKPNNRVRYESDGKRFLPDSRHHPMSINLPNLKSITLNENQTFGIIITIGTNTQDLNSPTYVHANDIFYHDMGAIRIVHGCCFVSLTPKDITDGVKEFPRLSILYKRYSDYTFNLTPFHPSTMFGTTESYKVPNQENMEKVAKGKLFKKKFNLSSYKLYFQLGLIENNLIYISDISCETNGIHEELPQQISRKRKISCSSESISDDDDDSSSKNLNSIKKVKSSPPILNQLPIVWASSQCNESDIDRHQHYC